MVEHHILERMVKDIKILFAKEDSDEETKAIYLWDNKLGTVENAKQYLENEELN